MTEGRAGPGRCPAQCGRNGATTGFARGQDAAEPASCKYYASGSRDDAALAPARGLFTDRSIFDFSPDFRWRITPASARTFPPLRVVPRVRNRREEGTGLTRIARRAPILRIAEKKLTPRKWTSRLDEKDTSTEMIKM